MLISKTRTLPIFVILCAFCFAAITHAETLMLVSSVPSNNATDISRTNTVTLEFSTALAKTSVNTSTVTLQSAAGTQKVALSVSDAVISVQPSTPLLPWTNYTLNISSVMGSNGDQLAAPIAITFKTRDATWQTPQLVAQTISAPVSGVHASATNAKGIRFIAWVQQFSDSEEDIWAIRQVPGTTPTEPTLIASYSRISPDPTDPHPLDRVGEINVTVDNDGNAFVTWVATISPVLEPTTQPLHLWASRFVVGSSFGSGWGTPQIIDGYAKRSATNTHLVFDKAGNAFALWQEYDCCALHSLQSIVVNRYTRTAGWSKPVHLDDSIAFLAGKIDIQVDDAGDAYATWSALADLHFPTPNLLVSHYTLATGWNVPQIIDTESTMNTTGHQALAVNPRGEAFLMWTDDIGLKFARADISGHWSKPMLIDATVKVSPSQLVLLDDDRAFAAFVNGVKNFIPANNAWTWTHPLLPNDENAGTDPHIVADISGNALVVWTQQRNGENRVFAKRYRASTGWASAGAIDNNPRLGAQLDDFFLEPSGSAVAAWWQLGSLGTTDLYTARFE